MLGFRNDDVDSASDDHNPEKTADDNPEKIADDNPEKKALNEIAQWNANDKELESKKKEVQKEILAIQKNCQTEIKPLQMDSRCEQIRKQYPDAASFKKNHQIIITAIMISWGRKNYILWKGLRESKSKPNHYQFRADNFQSNSRAISAFQKKASQYQIRHLNIFLEKCYGILDAKAKVKQEEQREKKTEKETLKVNRLLLKREDLFARQNRKTLDKEEDIRRKVWMALMQRKEEEEKEAEAEWQEVVGKDAGQKVIPVISGLFLQRKKQIIPPVMINR